MVRKDLRGLGRGSLLVCVTPKHADAFVICPLSSTTCTDLSAWSTAYRVPAPFGLLYQSPRARDSSP